MGFQARCKTAILILGALLLSTSVLGAVGLWSEIYLPSRIQETPPSLTFLIGQAVIPVASLIVGIALFMFSEKIASSFEKLLSRNSS